MILAIITIATATVATAWLVVETLRRYRKKLNRYLEYLPRHIWNTRALQQLVNSPVPLPAPTGWAADSDLLTELSRIVLEQKPLTVLELGSGLSSVILSATLRKNGRGQLFSIDHDTEYAAATSRLLSQNALNSFAKVLVAPLHTQIIHDYEHIWYDLSALEIPSRFDLVFVDGPPSVRGARSRAPALDIFWPMLSIGGCIVLDDAERKDEKAMIAKWADRNRNAKITSVSTLKGCTVILKSGQ